jgi:hypothetical protein
MGLLYRIQGLEPNYLYYVGGFGPKGSTYWAISIHESLYFTCFPAFAREKRHTVLAGFEQLWCAKMRHAEA